MKEIDVSYLNASEMVEALKAERVLGGSAFIWGNIGIGKSSVVRQFAKMMHAEDPTFDEEVVDIRLALKGPEDLQGLPTFTDKNGVKVTTWAIPEMFCFNPDWKGVIFLDEFNLSQPTVMNACYQLIQDRKVSGVELPKGAMIIAAGNPSDCNINATELPQALKNRFNHYYMKEDIDTWIGWALNNNINEDIITFIKTQRPELFLDHTRMDNEENEFATPRNWEIVSHIIDLPNTPKEVKKNVIRGRIGSVATAHLFNYLEDKARFQDPEDILIHKKPFIEVGLNSFYGCLLSALNRTANMKDINIRTEYTANICNSLKKLKSREWIIFAAKLMLNNENIKEVMSSEDIVEIAELG